VEPIYPFLRFMTMMTHIQSFALRSLRPFLVAAAILLSGPVFLVLDQSFSNNAPAVVAGDVLMPTRASQTTVIYKNAYLGT
jgi:hypothetical protein